MSIIQNRASTEVVFDTFLTPDGNDRVYWTRDFERGPKAITDTSEGNLYQDWILEYNALTGEFVATPQTEGAPQVLLTVLGVTQCTFTFDQNANPTLTYTLNEKGYLFWYDAEAEQYVTTEYPDAITPVVTLDDKRQIHVDRNDILFFYTREVSSNVFNCYYRQQRDRFTVERIFGTDTPPRILKHGMHQGLRVQLRLTYTEQI
jgi:hypothetical protein